MKEKALAQQTKGVPLDPNWRGTWTHNNPDPYFQMMQKGNENWLQT